MSALIELVSAVLAGMLVLALLGSLIFLAEQALKDFRKPFHLEGSDHVDNPHPIDAS